MTLTSPAGTRTGTGIGTETLDIRDLVGRTLGEFLDRRAVTLLSVSPALEPAARALEEFILTGGKRIRPAFCYWGWRGAGGEPYSPAVVGAAAALEMLHACALIHDDIMDASDTRRGRPSMHRRFADLHRDAQMRGRPVEFGTAAAILLGDFCLAWCDDVLDECALPAPVLRAAKSLFSLMQTELIAGQYLDMLGQAAGMTLVDYARRVIRYKTAKYTIERPMHLGGIIAGADEALLAAYSAFALPLGEAFQLRDDVLGAFGDPGETGKPAGDDFREGKRTVLVSLALRNAGRRQQTALEALLGDPDLSPAGVDTVRSIIAGTGALRTVERMIDDLTAAALDALALAPLADDARQAFAELTRTATHRRA
jgi:geranylgeranyl diphosphate synthase type I